MELIAELKLERQVLILEDVYDELLKQIYLRAKAVIYPSMYEGFGLPVVEAWRCNKPVITSNNSSMKEFGREASILLEDPKDREEMSQAIFKLFDDSAFYDDMVRQIPEKLKAYHPEVSSAKWNDLYKSII